MSCQFVPVNKLEDIMVLSAQREKNKAIKMLKW